MGGARRQRRVPPGANWTGPNEITIKLKVEGAAHAFFDSFEEVIGWCQAYERGDLPWRTMYELLFPVSSLVGFHAGQALSRLSQAVLATLVCRVWYNLVKKGPFRGLFCESTGRTSVSISTNSQMGRFHHLSFIRRFWVLIRNVVPCVAIGVLLIVGFNRRCDADGHIEFHFILCH
jgi:hypothetical protein